MKKSKKTESKIFDCAIIGGGPGGLLSALYLKRFRRSVVVFNTGKPRATWIPRIHNLLGVEGKLSGNKMLERIHTSLKKHQTHFVNAEAKVERDGEYFRVIYEEGELKAKKIILATGVEDNHPPFPNLTKLCAKGVMGYCPICDGFEQCDQPIALLVKDSEGLAKMEFLHHYSKNLHVLFLERFKISPAHLHLIKTKKIKVHRSKIKTVELADSGKEAVFQFGKGRSLTVKMVYVGLGVKIRDAAWAHLKSLKRTKSGYILVNSVQETSIPGMYAVGDCVNDLFQVSVAAGHAAIAATDVHNHLKFS